MTLTRRAFLGGVVAATTGGIGAVVLSRLGQRDLATTASHGGEESAQPFITPVKDFYRTDTILGDVPNVASETWRLRIHGMVDRELTLTYADVGAMQQVSRDITLGCISNPVGGDLIGTATWGGVLLADVLQTCGIDRRAEQLVSTSVDGWTCGTPVSAVMDGRDAMLATSMNGEPLTPVHGFPVRMVVPGLFGYVSATKWVTDIEATTWDAFDAYWVRNGWAKQGPFLSSSRIDVPRAGARVAHGVVQVGGFAWAPHIGVKSVEVRVDDGPWTSMSIVDGHSKDTWCQWTGLIDLRRGEHTLTVRMTDLNGGTQTSDVRPPEPSGATGLHSIAVRVA